MERSQPFFGTPRTRSQAVYTLIGAVDHFVRLAVAMTGLAMAGDSPAASGLGQGKPGFLGAQDSRLYKSNVSD